MDCCPLQPTYIVEKGRRGVWAKHMGLKHSAFGNTLGEHVGNLMGTHWELERNMLGTKEK
jgi:hypothetical protein